MSEAAIIAQLKTILEGVSGIGTVYAYEPYTPDLRRFKELFVAGGRVNAVTVTREATRAVERTNTQVERQHRFVIRWYYAVDTEGTTETAFQALLEAAFTALLDNYTLGGTAETSTPLQVDSVRPVMFAGVLCHRAEMSLEAQELVTPS